MRIELEETPQAGAVTLVQTILRVVLGAVSVAHGLGKLEAPATFVAELTALGVAHPDTVAQAVLGLELLTGAALVLGRYTRSAAFLVLCDILVSALLHGRMEATWQMAVGNPQLEALLLGAAACTLFTVVGGGPFALDAVLRRRARLRAIARDATWSRPPYVT